MPARWATRRMFVARSAYHASTVGGCAADCGEERVCQHDVCSVFGIHHQSQIPKSSLQLSRGVRSLQSPRPRAHDDFSLSDRANRYPSFRV